MRRLYSNEYIQPINKALLMGSPFRSRRKAIVKKPSGRYWDDQRNVWVPDPHKQKKPSRKRRSNVESPTTNVQGDSMDYQNAASSAAEMEAKKPVAATAKPKKNAKPPRPEWMNPNQIVKLRRAIAHHDLSRRMSHQDRAAITEYIRAATMTKKEWKQACDELGFSACSGSPISRIKNTLADLFLPSGEYTGGLSRQEFWRVVSDVFGRPIGPHNDPLNEVRERRREIMAKGNPRFQEDTVRAHMMAEALRNPNEPAAAAALLDSINEMGGGMFEGSMDLVAETLKQPGGGKAIALTVVENLLQKRAKAKSPTDHHDGSEILRTRLFIHYRRPMHQLRANWNDRMDYVAGMALEALGIPVDWYSEDKKSPAPPHQPVGPRGTSGESEVLGERAHQFDPLTPRAGGVRLMGAHVYSDHEYFRTGVQYMTNGALLLHTDEYEMDDDRYEQTMTAVEKAVQRQREATKPADKTLVLSSGTLAEAVRQFVPEMTMSQLWAAVARNIYAGDRRRRDGSKKRWLAFSPVPMSIGDTRIPALGELPEDGQFWMDGRPMKFRFTEE